MKLKRFYLFFVLFILSFANSFAMQEILGKEVPEDKLKLLMPWDEKKVKIGSLIAYKSGQCFYYASLHQKGKNGDYTVIIKSNKSGGIQTTHGRVATSDYLMLFAQK